MKLSMAMMLAVWLGCAAAAPVASADNALTPAQTAYLRQEVKLAQERFVREVAKIVDTKEIVVRTALPDRGRSIDPVGRMMAVLEQNLGRALTDEQKVAVRQSEDVYQAALREAVRQARKR